MLSFNKFSAFSLQLKMLWVSAFLLQPHQNIASHKRKKRNQPILTNSLTNIHCDAFSAWFSWFWSFSFLDFSQPPLDLPLLPSVRELPACLSALLWEACVQATMNDSQIGANAPVQVWLQLLPAVPHP